jgi:quinoprotein glucose dehydrogenase
MPLLLTAQPVDAERFGFGYRIRPSSVNIGELPVVKPPWSSITAYRLDSGEIAWQMANGKGPQGHPLLQALDLPDLGVPGNAPGLLVTKTAIFHGHRRGWEQPSTLRALDKSTGAFLWEHPVDGAHSVAPPMTYIAGGKQFIVLATGAGLQPGRLTAFRLP